jgi:hypothetical protein
MDDVRVMDDGVLMMGRSTQHPDPARLRHATEARRRACAHAPPPCRGSAVRILTWTLWALGLRAAAAYLHRLAAEMDPQLRIVDTLGMLLASGPPQWVLEKYARAHDSASK